MVVIDVEVLGGQHAATSSQMDERAVQWFDPQEGVCDGPEAVEDQSYAEEAQPPGSLSPTGYTVAVEITIRVRHNPEVETQAQRKREVEE